MRGSRGVDSSFKTLALSGAALLCWLAMTPGLGAEPYVSDEESVSPARFRVQAISDDPEQLRCQFTSAQLAILEKLNRADAKNLVKMGAIVVPDRWDLRELDYSPMPGASTWARTHGKALIVHQQAQAFGAYENGKLIHWGPVSSGAARRPTPSGYFHLNWKSKGRRSTVNSDWFLPWAFNFINKDGISFHQYELPGYPASHGCVRLLSRDAKWLYGWGDQWDLGPRGWRIEKQGTPVWIVGGYDYMQDPPWTEREYLAYGARIALGQEMGVVDDDLTPAPKTNEESIHVASTEDLEQPAGEAGSI